MLIETAQQKNEPISLNPRPIEVVLDADVGLRSIFLPPIEDLREIDVLKGKAFSVRGLSLQVAQQHQQEFAEELERARADSSRLPESTGHLFKLADLAVLAGDRAAEASFLEELAKLQRSPYLWHRVAENLMATGKEPEAERIFKGLDLASDVYANLRVAYFSLAQQKLADAMIALERALKIDATDFSARLFHGGLCLALGRYADALHSFRVAESERPNSSALQTNIGLAYLYLNQKPKSLRALKLAVSFDPLNKNAQALLADLAFAEKRNEDAIPSLRHYLEYEQSDPAIWGRLARALFHIGEPNEAISALKRQASLEEDSTVWNNLGAAYWQANDRQRSAKAFARAMELGRKEPVPAKYFFPAKNLSRLLANSGLFREALAIAKAVLSEADSDIVASDNRLSDLYVSMLHALDSVGESEQAANIAKTMLAENVLAPDLRAYLLYSTIAHELVRHGNTTVGLQLAEQALPFIAEYRPQNPQRRTALINNVVCAFAENGMLPKAQEVFVSISHLAGKEPYPTATLGLIHLRKGHLGRAAKLYSEAAQLCRNDSEKSSIKQKFYLEMGIAYSASEPKKARGFLIKAQKQKGQPGLAKRAAELLRALPST